MFDGKEWFLMKQEWVSGEQSLNLKESSVVIAIVLMPLNTCKSLEICTRYDPAEVWATPGPLEPSSTVPGSAGQSGP